MKRFKALLSIVIIMACVIFIAVTRSKAEGEEQEEYTQERAVEYAKSLEGQAINVDRYGYDCVDIAKIYFKVVGGKEYVSLTTLCGTAGAYNYAKPISNAAIPDGWVRKKYSDGYRPQPGDVAVWEAYRGRAGADGHVAVVVEVDGNTISVVEQDSIRNGPAEINKGISAEEPSCYIVPTFNQIVRYIVLVLDVSGAQIFEEPPSWMSLYGNEYTSDSSIEAVKAAAKVFLDDAEKAIDKNAISIVTYSEEAQVAVPFTTDFNKLRSALDAIERKDISNRSIHSGMQCAYELLQDVSEDKIKSVVLCTTGLTDCGEYSYEGMYGENTEASGWQNSETGIRLYAYANKAMECADAIKNLGATVYVIGVFDPIEANIPTMSSIHDVAHFLRQTATNLASSSETMFGVNDTSELEFVFGELREEVIGSKLVRIYNNSNVYRDNSLWEEPGGGMGLGGFPEEFLWGPSLFEISSRSLYDMSITSKDSANYNLAMMSGCLCVTAADANYLHQAYIDLGFDNRDICLYSYPGSSFNRPDALRNGSKFADDEDLAFSIASQTMTVNGTECDVVFIVARGTMTTWEGIKDGTCIADKEYYGYTAWDWIYEFEEDIIAGLEDYHTDHDWLGTRPLKILVTGHSLGGAAANLVAAKLDKECGGTAWYSANVTPDDIYAYTFGAIDSITNKDYDGNRIQVPVSEGFENIFNIYNYLDTFGPNGKKLFTARGNSMYGKFGRFYTFSGDMADVVKDSSSCRTHEIIGYIHALKNGWLNGGAGKSTVRVSIMCPVDVTVYEGKSEVCVIRGEQLISASPEVDVNIENAEKVILLPKGHDYRVVITATDSGDMLYVVQDIDDLDSEGVYFDNLQLEAGKIIVSNLDETSPMNAIELYVEDADGERIAQIAEDGTETSLVKEPDPTATPTPSPTLTPTPTAEETPTVTPTVAPTEVLPTPTEPTPADNTENSSGRTSGNGGGLKWIWIFAAVVVAVIVGVVVVYKKRQG